mmetsp:Transcript_50973/g.159282  ORF Transcript_50973/g.159282 Transcript_50973/m.159282 type:complete len:103 (-) Transcript_50973:957-1265(-)
MLSEYTNKVLTGQDGILAERIIMKQQEILSCEKKCLQGRFTNLPRGIWNNLETAHFSILMYNFDLFSEIRSTSVADLFWVPEGMLERSVLPVSHVFASNTHV